MPIISKITDLQKLKTIQQAIKTVNIAVAKAVRTVRGKRAFNRVLCDFIAVLSSLSVAIQSMNYSKFCQPTLHKNTKNITPFRHRKGVNH